MIIGALAIGTAASPAHAQNGAPPLPGTSEPNAPIIDCAAIRPVSARTWLAAFQANVPPVGTIWIERSGRRVGWSDFVADLLIASRGPALVLLGEVHDNPVHHRLRAELIRHLKCTNPALSAVVFEHIRADQRATLKAALNHGAVEGRDAVALDVLRALEWDNSGWPAASMFAPLFQAVLDAGLTIQPGNPPRRASRAMARDGLSALSTDQVARLQLSKPLPTPLETALKVELRESHCNLLPPSAIAAMTSVQRYRDAHLADRLLVAASTQGGAQGSAVLVAGNGHVRKDRGVPWFIRQRAPQRPVSVVVFVEAEPGRDMEATAMPRGPDERPAADYVVFTSGIDRPDPCIGLRRRWRKRGEAP